MQSLLLLLAVMFVVVVVDIVPGIIVHLGERSKLETTNIFHRMLCSLFASSMRTHNEGEQTDEERVRTGFENMEGVCGRRGFVWLASAILQSRKEGNGCVIRLFIE